MTTPEPTPDPEVNMEPAHFRLKLSPNQKKRSKLQQVPLESPAVATPQPEPVAAPEPPEAPAPPQLRKMRLKRSGHMHDDLTKPLPEADESERGPEY